MGSHQCPFIDDYKKAEVIGVAVGMTKEEVKAAYYSSHETTLGFASDNSWKFPDMLPLYVALGHRPEQAFIDDVMSGTVTSYDVIGSMGTGKSGFNDERRPSQHTKQELQDLIDEAGKMGPAGIMKLYRLSQELDRAYGPTPVGYLQGNEKLSPLDPLFAKEFIARLREAREEGRNLSQPTREVSENMRNFLDNFDPFAPHT